MQQLSLFDFGEEAPKPEKKKKASKDGLQQAGSIPVKASPDDPSSEQSTPSSEEPSAPLEQDPALVQSNEQPNEQMQQQGQEQAAAIPTPPEQPVTATQNAETAQSQSLSHDEAPQQTASSAISEASEEESVTDLSNVPKDQPQLSQHPEQQAEQLSNQHPVQEPNVQPEANTEKELEKAGTDESGDTNEVAAQSDTPQQNAVNAISDQGKDLDLDQGKVQDAQMTNNAQSTFELSPPQQNEETKVSDVQQETSEVKGINSEKEPAASDFSKDVQDLRPTSESSEDAMEASNEPSIEANETDSETKSDEKFNESSASLQDNNNNNIKANDDLNAEGVENESVAPAAPTVPAEATDQPSAPADLEKEQIQTQTQEQTQDQDHHLQDQNEAQGDNPPASGVVFANEQFGVKVVVKTVKSVKIESIKMPPRPVHENPENLENAEDSIEKEDASHESDHEPDQSKSEDSRQLTTSEITQQDPEAAFDTSFSPDDFSNHTDADGESEVDSATAEAETKEAEEEEEEEEELVAPLNNTGLPTLPTVIENTTETESDSFADDTPDHASKSEASDQLIEKNEEAAGNQSKEGLDTAKKQQNTDSNSAKKPYYIEDQTVPVRKRGRKSFKEIDAEVDLINVPPDEELFQKQYYPISVVAKWFRVNNSLLRFWENEFKILKPRKNKKGDRFFRPEDVKNLQLIYYLLRQKKLTINGAIKHLNSYREQTEVNLQLIQTLNEFKGFLLELRAATEK